MGVIRKIKSKESLKLANDLVLCARILVLNGLDSGPFGNVSVRIPGTNNYWINSNGIPFPSLSTKDLVFASINNNEESSIEDTQMHPGDCIHQQIYLQRPDVMSVVHTHSHSTVMLSTLGVPIEPFTQVGASFYNDQGIYKQFNGPVRDYEEGYQIARSLAGNSIVIAERHGIFATASSLSAALWNMMLADWAAREHLHAIQLGIPKAQNLDLQIIKKCRTEVRDKMHSAIWRGEVGRLKELSPQLFKKLRRAS